jgi:hypothetical protein
MTWANVLEHMATMLASLAAAFAATAAAIAALRTKKEVVAVRLEIDGRLDELLKEARKASFHEGKEHERSESKKSEDGK